MTLLLHEMLWKKKAVAVTPPPAADFSVGVVGTSLSTAATINYPAGIQAGDLIIMGDRASVGSNPYCPYVTPAGFTLLSQSQSSNTNTTTIRQRVVVSYRLATGPLTGSVTGMNGTVADGKVMYVLRRTSGGAISSVTPFAYPTDSTNGAATRSVSIGAGTIPSNSLFFSFATTVNNNDITSHTLSPAPYATTRLSPATYMSSLFSNFPATNPAMTVTGTNNAGNGGGVTTAAYLAFA